MSLRVLSLGAAAVFAFAAAPEQVQADFGTKYWNVCGGNHFATCAAVSLAVTDHGSGGISDIAIRVWNLSGYDGTWAGTIFTRIGFFNAGSGLAFVGSEGDYVDGMSGGGTIGTPDWWKLGSSSSGGGVDLDFASSSGYPDHSVDNGIASLCDPSLLPGGSNSFWTTGCYSDLPTDADGKPIIDWSSAGFVEINFQITGTWNMATTELLIHGQNGPDGLSTQCITGDNCRVPEPGTLLLLATGLTGLAAVRRRRDLA